MNWIFASLLSAFFLGLYDLSTKHAVRDNAVLPVLFFSNLCSTAVWIGLMAVQQLSPAALPGALAVAPMSWGDHGLLFAKSALVAASWMCTYFAVKHLPMSIAAPVRATSPLWTLACALLILQERPNTLEMLGIATTLLSFFGLSLAGRKEGIHFHKDKWILILIGGTMLNGVSGMYDKFLLGRLGFNASTVQAWFSIYLAVIFLPMAVGWKLRWWPRNTFEWRWSIVSVSFALLVADFIYFDALRNPDALVSVVSSMRRGSTLVAFAGGLWFFGETNGWRKLPAVLGVLAGILLTMWA